MGRFHSLWLIACLSLVVFLGKSWETSLRGLDSNIHATVGLSLTAGEGALPMPRLPAPIPNEVGWKPALSSSTPVFNDHPFPFLYAIGISIRKLGDLFPGATAWAARLPTALAATGCVVLTYLIGAQLSSVALGLTAALILLFTRDFILSGASVSLDPPMVFCILASFYFWIRGGALRAGGAAGLGLWVKTPVALLLLPVAAIEAVVERGSGRRWAVACVTALGVGAAVWLLAASLGGTALVFDYWGRQVLGTGVHGRGEAQGPGVISYLLRVYGYWLPLLAWSLYRAAVTGGYRERRVRLPLVAALVLGAVVSLLSFKMSYYYLPIFPFLALLAATGIESWVAARLARIERGLAWVVPGLLAFLLATPVSFGPEFFPALRKFAPFIPAGGRGALLDAGAYPYSHDAVFFLNHYAGQPVRVIGCEGAAAALADVTWVVGRGDEIERCLDAGARARFPTALGYGEQRLLSVAPVSTTVDLSPLGRELRWRAP